MSVKKVGKYQFTANKTFNVYSDERNYYLAKQAPLSSYELLLDISQLSKTSAYLATIDYFQTQDDKLVYLTQIYQGRSLEQAINDHIVLSQEQVKVLIYQLCSGLKSLHARGIIHRDIKPANIILTPECCVIIDYDITRKYNKDKYNDTTALGTKYFASPEQYGFKQTTPQSDIYSLGKTLEVVVSKCCNHTTQTFFAPLIKQASALDPKDRFEDIDAMLTYLQEHRLGINQIEQIKQLQAINASEWVIDDIYHNNYNDRQIGVIKHAINEGVSRDCLKLMLDDNLSSRQMWQIKEGNNNHLSSSQIRMYAKNCYSAEEMALFRNLLITNTPLDEIYSRIKNYNYIIYHYHIDTSQLIAVRNYFIYLNDVKLIKTMIKSKTDLVASINERLQPLRSKYESKILR